MSITLERNLIAVTTYADQRLLEAASKTIADQKELFNKAKSTIDEQARENTTLRGRLVQVEAEKVQALAAITAEMTAIMNILRASGVDLTVLLNSKLADLGRLQWGQFDEKIAKASEILAIKPDQPTALLLRGHGYYYQKNYEFAWRDVTKAYAVSPKDFWIVYYVGLTALQRGDRTKAIEFVEKAATLDPGSCANHESLAVSLFELNRFASAIAHSNKAIQLNAVQAKESRAILAASRLCQELEALPWGQFDAKIAKASDILAIKPTQSTALFLRGHAYYYQEKVDLAWQDISKAYEVNPQDYWIVYYVGLTALKRGELAKAVEFVEKAAILAPDRFEPHESLSEIYFDQNDLTSAQKAAQKALSLNPERSKCRELLDKIQKRTP